MNEWLNEWMTEWMNDWMNEWMNEGRKERTNKERNERKNGLSPRLKNVNIKGLKYSTLLKWEATKKQFGMRTKQIFDKIEVS